MIDAQATAAALTVMLLFALGAILLLVLSLVLVRQDNDQLVDAVLAHNKDHADELEQRRQARRDRDARRAAATPPAEAFYEPTDEHPTLADLARTLQ